MDIDIYPYTHVQQMTAGAATGIHSRVLRTRARLRGRSRRGPTPCAARACPAATVGCRANRACRAAWAHHRLVLQQLSMRAAHGLRAKHREQQGWHEQREHAHAAQVDGSAHRRQPRRRAGRCVGAPAPTSRIDGSHSHGRPAQAATCDKARTTPMWGGQRAYRLGGGGRVVALPRVAAPTELAISAAPRAPTASTPSSKYQSGESTDAAHLRCICATRIDPRCSEGAARTRTRR